MQRHQCRNQFRSEGLLSKYDSI